MSRHLTPEEAARLPETCTECDRLRGALEGLERVVSRFPLQERSWPLIVVEWAKDLKQPLEIARAALEAAQQGKPRTVSESTRRKMEKL